MSKCGAHVWSQKISEVLIWHCWAKTDLGFSVHQAAKCLASNLKLVGRILASFGLQQSGLFRRALVLPLLLRASACEHSKVRAAAGDCLLQLLGLSGGHQPQSFLGRSREVLDAPCFRFKCEKSSGCKQLVREATPKKENILRSP